MKYRDKDMPEREVHFWDGKLVGNDRVRFTMGYSTNSKDTETYVRQPIVMDLCSMRTMGHNFHSLLDELEDRLLEARDHMKGER